MERARSWNTAFHKAQREYGKKVKISKTVAGGIPPQFTESPMSLHMGAKKVYRDQQATDSYQIREYDDYYTVQMDRHNPDDGNAVKHALTDALPYTVAAVGFGAVVFGGGGG